MTQVKFTNLTKLQCYFNVTFVVNYVIKKVEFCFIDFIFISKHTHSHTIFIVNLCIFNQIYIK